MKLQVIAQGLLGKALLWSIPNAMSIIAVVALCLQYVGVGVTLLVSCWAFFVLVDRYIDQMWEVFIRDSTILEKLLC